MKVKDLIEILTQLTLVILIGWFLIFGLPIVKSGYEEIFMASARWLGDNFFVLFR